MVRVRLCVRVRVRDRGMVRVRLCVWVRVRDRGMVRFRVDAIGRSHRSWRMWQMSLMLATV